MALLFSIKDEPGQEASKAVSHHLPRGPGPLAEKEITGKGGNGPCHKPCLRAQGNSGDHDNGGNGLETGKQNRHPGSYRQSTHNRNGHKLPGLGLSGLKGQEKWNHGLDDNQGTGQIVPSSLDLCAQKQCCGNQDNPGKDIQKRGLSHTLPSKFARYSAATSLAVTAF